MPAIAMCEGRGCPRRAECYRFRAVPTPLSQVYFAPPLRADGSCDEFLVLRKGDRLTDPGAPRA